MNLLVTGAWHEAREYTGELETLGHKVQMLQWEKDSLPCAYEWVEGVICNGLFLHHPIEKFTNLRYIQLTSAGYDRVPLDYIQSHGIELYNAKGVYSIPMAEHAVSGVLQLYRQTRLFDKNQRIHKWKKARDLVELYGKTVCIVGCGSVGTECAKRFQAFGCQVIGLRQSMTKPYSSDGYSKIHSVTELDELLPQIDILVLALPLTEKTRYLINRKRISCFKQGIVLVNLARGAIIETDALKDALESGTVRGAVLDVFEEEPLSEEDALWDMENVILTPHISYAGEGNSKRLSEMIIGNMDKWSRKRSIN